MAPERLVRRTFVKNGSRARHPPRPAPTRRGRRVWAAGRRPARGLSRGACVGVGVRARVSAVFALTLVR